MRTDAEDKREREEERQTKVMRSLAFEQSEKVWGERWGVRFLITVASTGLNTNTASQ